MIIKRIYNFIKRWSNLPFQIYKIQEALGRIEQRQTTHISDFRKSEFRVFSQWGEDGIIQFLLQNVSIKHPIFVEFGVENYTESNTRFLLTNNQWSGIVIDGNDENIEYIKKDPIYWAANLKAISAFITKDNINELITANGVKGDIGILSIDIDGNDYWVWKAIECISPRIVICEYNSLFGPVAEVTTPYNPDFVRDTAHFSKVYYGASISALNKLAVSKGYSLVATNSVGNNIFFIRNDLIKSIPILTPSQTYLRSHFREFHDESGNLTFDDFDTRLKKISHLPVYDLKTEKLSKIKDIIGILKR